MIIFDTDVELLENRLKLNGFPYYLIDTCIGKVLNEYHVITPDNSNNTNSVDKHDVAIALPYLDPLSILLRRGILRLVRKFYPTIKNTG